MRMPIAPGISNNGLLPPLKYFQRQNAPAPTNTNASSQEKKKFQWDGLPDHIRCSATVLAASAAGRVMGGAVAGGANKVRNGFQSVQPSRSARSSYENVPCWREESS